MRERNAECTITSNLDVLAQVARLAIDLDAVVQVLLERRAVKDAIARRLRVVDDELVLCGGGLTGGGLGRLAVRRTSEASQAA